MGLRATQCFISQGAYAMPDRTMKIPGPDHPITIEKTSSHVVVSVLGKTIADSHDAVLLREAHYPPVLYVPRKDVDMTLLERTEQASYCPYKGDCSYYSIPTGKERSINAIWTYETPYEAVSQIAGHMAFYPDRVDSISVTPTV
jgi:uncharacterized protein (DUF427 family)